MPLVMIVFFFCSVINRPHFPFIRFFVYLWVYLFKLYYSIKPSVFQLLLTRLCIKATLFAPQQRKKGRSLTCASLPVYLIFTFREFKSIHKGKTAILHLCFGTEKNRRLGSKKARYIRAFRRRHLFCLHIMAFPR